MIQMAILYILKNSLYLMGATAFSLAQYHLIRAKATDSN